MTEAPPRIAPPPDPVPEASGDGGKRRRKEKAGSSGRTGAWYPRWYWPSFAVPGTLYLAVFFLVPFYVVISLAFGFTNPYGTPEPVYQPWFWTTSYMSQAIGDAFGQDREVYLRTFGFVILSSIICVLIAYTVAYYVSRYGGKKKGMYLLLLIAPFFISYLMRMLAWRNLLSPDGYVNKIMGWFPFLPHNVNWQAGNRLALLLGLVYGYVPYMVFPLYAFLDRIEPSLLEAGRDLGASPTRTFFRVTLPLSKQAILAGIVIISLPMFGDYYTHDILTPSPTVNLLGNLLDQAKASGAGSASRTAALALIIVFLMLIPMAYYMWSTSRELKRA